MGRVGAWVLGTILVTSTLFACGARTGLLVPEPEDAGPDARPDHRDAQDEDVLPTIDASKRDAYKVDCPLGEDAKSIFVVTETDELLSFHPPDASFKKIGVLKCPAPAGYHPFSMAVDRHATAYVLYGSDSPSNGRLFKVNTTDASCEATAYVPRQDEFGKFGMGFATRGLGPEEDLYVASFSGGVLGKIDLANDYKLTAAGIFKPLLDGAELTGTGDGRLYAFYDPSSWDTAVAEVAKTSGAVLGQDLLVGTTKGTAWAFATWGGYFWLFTNPAGQKVVRWDPATKTALVVGGYSAPIVGAGVSTCAP